MQARNTLWHLAACAAGSIVVSVAVGSWPANGLAAEDSATSEATYPLQYKYHVGEVITYTIEHLAKVDTTIAGNTQKTQMQSKSTRSLHVKEVQADGSARFVHVIDDVDMWSEVDGRAAVRYNSREDDKAPPGYEHVAESIGVPISEITMSPSGEVLQRKDHVVHPNFGLGGISIPLPKGPVHVGQEWDQPQDLQIRLEDNRIKTIKTRQLFRLEKVETGVATISVKTQVLTPVDDPRVRSQLVQRISSGEIRFDVDAGRLLTKQLDWDENVLGFNGAESNMKYLARFTERLRDNSRTADSQSSEDSSPR
jgi:hypothetical protein